MYSPVELKEVMFHYLRRFRFFLALMIVGALAGGLIKLVPGMMKLYREQANLQTDSSTVSMDSSNNETIDMTIAFLRNKQYNYMEYIENSLPVQRPFEKMHTAYMSVYIAPDEYSNAWNPTPTFANVYAEYIDTNVAPRIANQFGLNIDPKYVKDFISCRIGRDESILVISATHNDKTTADNMMTAMEGFLFKYKGEMEKIIGPHRFNVITRYARYESNTEWSERYLKILEDAQSIQGQLLSYQEEYLVPEGMDATSRRAVLTSTIKFGIVGVVGGFLLAFAILFLFDMSSNTIQSFDDAQKRFSVKVLGSLDLKAEREGK